MFSFIWNVNSLWTKKGHQSLMSWIPPDNTVGTQQRNKHRRDHVLVPGFSMGSSPWLNDAL